MTDNVSELTARINDDGWDSSYEEWLRSSRLAAEDCLFVFSVGGGSLERQVSVNLVRAMHLARDVGASIVGIAGRDGGELRKCADACVVLPSVDADLADAADRRAASARLAPDGLPSGTRPEHGQVGVDHRRKVRSPRDHELKLRAAPDDHHQNSAPHHPRRWRHRPSELLPPQRWWLPDRGGDHEVRLHRGEPQLRRRPAAEVLERRTRRGTGRCAASSAPRDPPRDAGLGRHRDLVDGRHPRGNRPRVIGRVHGGCVEGAPRAQARAGVERAARRPRVSDRDRPAR